VPGDETPSATDSSASPLAQTPNAKRPPRRFRRFALRGLLVLVVLLVGLWIAAHRIPWVGSTLADGLRAVIGTDAVAKIEDFVYGLEDRWNQFWRADEAPKAYWEVPSEEPQVVAPTPSEVVPSEPALPPFKLEKVGPLHKSMAAAGDGVWVPVADPARPGAPPLMYKTLIHPDGKRPWAELFVVALDLRQIELRFVLGTAEPKATDPAGREVERPGLIPTEVQEALLAAFNGGFKLEHGHWGAGVGGTTIVTPREHGCTVAATRDGALLIDRWPDLEPQKDTLVWWRQTPPCMFNDDKRHGGLWDPDAKGWGAALEGDTVIRRSAIGLSKDRQVLFVGMSNHTAAQALADGMHHAGAVDIAQLDVNWSYPRFTVFPLENGMRKTKSLFEGFEVGEDDYLREPQIRDFFYVVRKP
jgi:hypothetical protein